MEIRLIKQNEFEKVHKLIKITCETSWTTFYPKSSIEYVIELTKPDKLKETAKGNHFYVVVENGQIIGCGGIRPYYGSLTESGLFVIFVNPNYQGKGIGTLIIKTLENDDYGKRAKRIEIPSSIPAIPFYRKLGYEHKNNLLNYEDGHFALEKFPTK